MRNKHGLTPKEWKFAEDYLKNGGNVAEAYRVAYPTDSGTNGWEVIKRKHVLAYIQKRIEQKQHTFDVILDRALQRLYDIIETGSDKDANIAIETITKLTSHLKPDKDSKDDVKGITIDFNIVSKNENKD